MSNGSERVRTLLKTFGIEETKDQAVIDCALTYHRQLMTKIPNLGNVEAVREHIAIDLALGQILSTVFVDRKAIIANTGVKPNEYEQKLKLCKTLLGLKDSVALIDLLAANSGGNLTRISAYKLLSAYNVGYVQKLPIGTRDAVKLSDGIYHGAAFLLTAQRQGVKVSKDEIIKKSHSNANLFNDICKSMKMFESVVIKEEMTAALSGNIKNTVIKDTSATNTSVIKPAASTVALLNSNASRKSIISRAIADDSSNRFKPAEKRKPDDEGSLTLRSEKEVQELAEYQVWKKTTIHSFFVKHGVATVVDQCKNNNENVDGHRDLESNEIVPDNKDNKQARLDNL